MLAVIFVFIESILRILPHLPNFSPMNATAIFGGANLKKRLAFLITLSSLALSDYLLLYINPFQTPMVNFSTFHSPSEMFYPTTPFVWGSFLISVGIGLYLRGKRVIFSEHGIKIVKPFYLLFASLFASIQFFLITNFGVWATGMYARGLSGLLESYIMGLPFFKWTLLGDLFYTIGFFSLYALVLQLNTQAFHRQALQGEESSQEHQ